MENKQNTKLAHNAIAERCYELYKDDVTDFKFLINF